MSDQLSAHELRWKGLRAALDEFQGYLAPRIPRFEIIAANDWNWTDEQYAQRRPAGFPSRMCGVYLMFDEGDALLYVGSALVNFDKRVWSHDKLFDSHGVRRRWTDVVVMPAEYAFLAPSLECFLISRLEPKCNTSLKGYNVPALLEQLDER